MRSPTRSQGGDRNAMITACTAAILLLIILFPTVVEALALLGARRRSPASAPADAGEVTILVAAHNEEEHLPALLRCLRAQTHPHDRCHAILGLDRCTDGTAAIAAAADLDGMELRVMSISDVQDGASPKKRMLDAMIGGARTEFLLFTDADCMPEPGWAASMTAALAGADVVIGLSPVLSRGGWAGDLAAYESWRTALLMCGAAGWGRPYMALGRNWGYRRSLYHRSGGLEPIMSRLSGDDDLLLQRFIRVGARVATCVDQGAQCPTDAPDGMVRFRRQRARHLGAGRAYPLGVLAVLGMQWAAQMACVVSPLVAIFACDPACAIVMTVASILKLVLDSAMIRLFASRHDPHHLPAARRWVLLEPVSVIVSGFAALRALARREVW